MDNLYLNKEIYDRKLIIQASNDFAQLAMVRVTDGDSYWICSFEQCKVSSSRIMNEFENYLIGLFNRKGF